MILRIEENTWESLASQLLARTDVETAAVILAEPIDTADGLLLVARTISLVPGDGYLIRRADKLRIDPLAINGLIRPARDRGWSVLTVHSHPNSSAAWFSKADDLGDARILPSFANQIPGPPHGALVVTGTRNVVGRLWLDGAFEALTIQTVGRTLKSLTITQTTEAGERFARQQLALGAHGQSALGRLRVGVVGLGGIGSQVAVQLAHLGVGDVVLIDGDQLQTSNLSRVVGATPSDVGLHKTVIAERYIHALGGDVNVRTSERFLSREEDLRSLAHCDVIMSCVDRHTPRAILNRFAYRSLVPVIDMGTAFRVDPGGKMVGSAGRVVIVGPGRPCLACWGHLNPQALRQEALSPDERASEVEDGYIDGAAVPQPSVIPFNTMVAGAGVIELLRLVTSFAGADDGPLRLAFGFDDGTVRRNSLATKGPCEVCAEGTSQSIV